MNLIVDGVIVDACTLKNFSVVDRMDVLQAYFRGRAQWTEAIAREAGRLGLPPLDWLGPAMSPGEDIAAQALMSGIGLYQLAWPFSPLVPGDLDDFIGRWTSWLASGSLSRLNFPSTMPERPAEWRR